MGSKREYQLEDGKLILDRVRSYFNVSLTTPPKSIVLSKDDQLYLDIAAYFKVHLNEVSCNITMISILQNRTLWERYQQFKSLQQAIEKEENDGLFQPNFETAFKDTVLFHGTQPDNVTSILDHGLDGRFSKALGNCGPAIYLSPSFDKCDLFASRHNSKRALVVCVTALGKIYDNTKDKTVNLHTKYPPKGFHSVKHYVAVADEYVVYENSQVLPILAIHYEKSQGQHSNPFMIQLPGMKTTGFNSFNTNNQSTSKWSFNNGNTSSQFNTTGGINSCGINYTSLPPIHLPNFNLPPIPVNCNQTINQVQVHHPHPITVSSNWMLRKAQIMIQQWTQQVDLSKGIASFYGVPMASKQFWPVKSHGEYPYLVKYLDFVLNRLSNISSSKLDQGFINMLKKLKSYDGIVHAKRRQVEKPRSINLFQFTSLATQDRLREAAQESCTICAELIINFRQPPDIVKMNNCPHIFHKSCIETWLYMPSSQMICPNCKTPCHDPMAPPPIGPMPDGEMSYSFSEKFGAWFISYSIPNGKQLPCHPSPGKPFKGTSRTAICPIYQKWGPLLFIRMLAAFYYHHTFTVGTSLTTNISDVIIWNGIHHKTTIDGGFGFPDSTYEERVSLELDGKGILLFLRDLKKE
ncbi:7745_t:CDS:2 [Funneliformis geosporum]|uniref:Poly [ADP-ribose] polymerase n=1 Tax=Funneliformis geosporum TaxID=1117311 RepID=A0A9W4SRX6_9GLOM|nr:16050_t:CDS:2 [Funneliformis geosporum]CAI2183637.1 7745_t:CDS:2 [Funneliformis geosporum]